MMLNKKMIFVFIVAVLVSTRGLAQHADVKVLAGDMQLVEAYNQRIVLKKGGLAVETHFIAIWHGKDHPKSFVWVSKGSALSCMFSKARTVPPKNKKPVQGQKYYAEKIAPDKIREGDTLDVSPMNVINSTVPIREQQRLRNTLLYTTSDKAIMYTLEVEAIGQAEDVVMP